jgi:hypothetical protein
MSLKKLHHLEHQEMMQLQDNKDHLEILPPPDNNMRQEFAVKDPEMVVIKRSGLLYQKMQIIKSLVMFAVKLHVKVLL